MTSTEIRFEVNGLVSSEQLNALYDAAWPSYVAMDFAPLLPHYLAYVCAYNGIRLMGWVYLAWDGWQHAFLLDPTVHPEYRRLGIGRELVRLAANAARRRAAKCCTSTMRRSWRRSTKPADSSRRRRV
jgi:ribosomal protein S18 acetylase RimI-like enzyme